MKKRKPGRPRDPASLRSRGAPKLNMWLAPELHARLVARAKAAGETIAPYVRMALDARLRADGY